MEMEGNTDNSILKRTEDLFFLLQHSLTNDAKNTVWHFLELAKDTYPTSPHPEDWDGLLESLQKLMLDFANDGSSASEMRLLAIQQNAIEMKKKHDKSIGEA
jgi:hypothetical protein